MVKKPKKFLCGKMWWSIHWVDRLHECKGYTETPTNSVFVDSSLDEETQRHVLLHEIFHVIWYAYHLNPPRNFKYDPVHGENRGTMVIEEYICSTIPQALLQVLDDNPKLKKYFLGD